jgi:hypothetical protein
MYLLNICNLTKDVEKKMNFTIVVPFAGSNGMDTVFVATILSQPLCDSMAKEEVEGFKKLCK